MIRLKLYLGIFVVALFGALVGSFITSLYIKHQVKQVVEGGPAHRRAFLMKRLTRELDLNEKQQIEVQKILKQTFRRLHELRKRHRPKVKEILDQGMNQIRVKLDERQKKKFNRFLERFRKRIPHHPPMPPPPPFPPGE